MEVGLPLGNFGNATSFGIGGSLGFELPVADNIGAVVQAGFMSFSGKDQSYGLVTVEGGNWTMIPIQVGAKYYFTNDQEGFYAMGLVGIHSMSYKIPGYTTTLFGVSATTPEQKFSDTNLSFAPAIGYVVGENIDVALRYQIISGTGGSSSYLGIRAAYMFGL
ncbi:MAG: hypothetical protein IPO56_04610 [Flavobacteriales bacterium]|nr:hypothetical protein [Flavobacteriales bacterium]